MFFHVNGRNRREFDKIVVRNLLLLRKLEIKDKTNKFKRKLSKNKNSNQN